MSYDICISRQRRNWTPEEKVAVVLEIIREESILAEISRKYEIAQPVLSRWKAEFFENMATLFDKKGESVFRVYDVSEPGP
ncbi:transposase [Acetoanaerobium pronyense]|uniref:transposase n=1 Tax=Acetoanaerobium pronyense TaxID=1482736 RepID=UPI001AE25661